VLHVLPLMQDKLVFVVFENQDAKFFQVDDKQSKMVHKLAFE